MVQNAKGVAQNPRDQAGTGRWRGANQQVLYTYQLIVNITKSAE